MAIFTPKRLSGPALLTTSAAPAYTVPAGITGVLKQVVFNNITAASATVTMHVVPNGATVVTSNQVVSQLSLAGYSQLIWTADIPLNPGDAIHLLASVTNTITATSSGIEIS